jgi:hypothetical protein
MKTAISTNDNKRWREQRTQFLGFLLFSVLEIGYLLYSRLTFTVWRDWIFLGGAVLFSIMTIISWRSMRNNRTAEQEDRAVTLTFGYIVAGPIILLIAVLAGFALFSMFGWLATIPSWAAVIIVLLVLIYLK